MQDSGTGYKPFIITAQNTEKVQQNKTCKTYILYVSISTMKHHVFIAGGEKTNKSMMLMQE